MKTPFKLALVAAALGLTTACAPPGAPYSNTHNGARMGATAGAVLGHQLDFWLLRLAFRFFVPLGHPKVVICERGRGREGERGNEIAAAEELLSAIFSLNRPSCQLGLGAWQIACYILAPSPTSFHLPGERDGY